MTNDEYLAVCTNAVLKIIDNEWQLTRPELEQAVQETVQQIFLEATAKARLELNENTA